MRANSLEVCEKHSEINVFKSYVQGEKKTFFLYCHGAEEIKNIIVLVHGISRNYKQMFLEFHSFCDENTLIIAPHFSIDYCSDYQRLGRKNRGPRADYILKSIVNKMRSELGFHSQKFNLFGFSAGAQFAHRYAFAHPQDVSKVVLVSAGWYTFPVYSENYPLGLTLSNQFTDITFEIERILAVKFKLYVGTEDNLRNKALNKHKKIDFLQGKNRIERARQWKNQMNNMYAKNSINTKIVLNELKGVSHSFSEAISKTKLIQNVMNWFLR